MAKIFAVHGTKQRGAALAELPWHTCIELCELDAMCRVEDRPKFGDAEKGAVFPTRIVIQVEDEEARRHGIQPGFFESPLPVQTAMARLEPLTQSKN
jgi:hypothetical protein